LVVAPVVHMEPAIQTELLVEVVAEQVGPMVEQLVALAQQDRDLPEATILLGPQIPTAQVVVVAQAQWAAQLPLINLLVKAVVDCHSLYLDKLSGLAVVAEAEHNQVLAQAL
jgi:hypothetical protein